MSASTNLHAAMIRAAGGLWKGGTASAGQQQQLQALNSRVGNQSNAATLQALEGRLGFNTQPAPEDDGVMSPAEFQSELTKIQKLNLSTPPAPTGPGDYSAGLTPAPLTAPRVPVGGVVSGV